MQLFSESSPPQNPPASSRFAPQCWTSAHQLPVFSGAELAQALEKVREPIFAVRSPQSGAIGVITGSDVMLQRPVSASASWELIGWFPGQYPEWLGDRSFCEMHGTRFPYVTGAMANGIATTTIVKEMAKLGALGFFGSAGLSVPRVEAALDELNRELGDRYPWGMNFIHAPQEAGVEEAIADLYIRKGVKRIEAAAFMSLTPSILRCALTGLKQLPDGTIHRERYVFAKISRPEVAKHFLEPAPQAMVDALVSKGMLTAEEGRLARFVPVAEDIIVESDSGGHTDNRPLAVLFPVIAGLRDQIAQAQNYARPIRIGAAGGLGCPSAVAAAFALGAAFVVTGTVNQACVESGLDASGKQMLATADMADVIMAPAADMFEMGVEVQVLRRGTMFATRARKLYELYRTYPSMEAIPAEDRQRVESQMLQATFDEAWRSTRDYWSNRDPHEVARAEQDPKHKMALVFRAYLGQSSRWAIAGDPGRKADFQIWCGPAMGSFNRWTTGTFLEKPEARTVSQVALNLLEGAAVIARAQQLRSIGVPVPASAFEFKPRPLA